MNKFHLLLRNIKVFAKITFQSRPEQVPLTVNLKCMLHRFNCKTTLEKCTLPLMPLIVTQCRFHDTYEDKSLIQLLVYVVK